MFKSFSVTQRTQLNPLISYCLDNLFDLIPGKVWLENQSKFRAIPTVDKSPGNFLERHLCLTIRFVFWSALLYRRSHCCCVDWVLRVEFCCFERSLILLRELFSAILECAAIWLSMSSLLRPRVKRLTWLMSFSFASVKMRLFSLKDETMVSFSFSFISMSVFRSSKALLNSILNVVPYEGVFDWRKFLRSECNGTTCDVSEESNEALSFAEVHCDDFEGCEPIIDFDCSLRRKRLQKNFPIGWVVPLFWVISVAASSAESKSKRCIVFAGLVFCGLITGCVESVWLPVDVVFWLATYVQWGVRCLLYRNVVRPPFGRHLMSNVCDQKLKIWVVRLSSSCYLWVVVGLLFGFSWIAVVLRLNSKNRWIYVQLLAMAAVFQKNTNLRFESNWSLDPICCSEWFWCGNWFY